ncbi:protein of unknown function [uncultured Sphingopyxis sp.]|uniref:Uncharacterized protein n=1 Tax=uncultured Sphingopyxis sp. TaxID=310581 RepID=A0A1Y5PU35_9SPHN|nr:protein of unknown function [uncultured Sphingopyxis sp.]
MAFVAEGLGLRRAAAAQARMVDARDGAARPADDFQIAAHFERSVGFGLDRERAAAHREFLALVGGRLAGRLEADIFMRLVAERLALRRAAAAERGAKTRLLAVERHVGAHHIGAVFAQADQIDRRHRFALPVAALIGQRPRRAFADHRTEIFDFARVGENPRPLHVGEEGGGRAGDAEARVDAAPAVEFHGDVLAFGAIDGIACFGDSHCPNPPRGRDGGESLSDGGVGDVRCESGQGDCTKSRSDRPPRLDAEASHPEPSYRSPPPRQTRHGGRSLRGIGRGLTVP